jgi:hypothetical protein
MELYEDQSIGQKTEFGLPNRQAQRALVRYQQEKSEV